MKWTNETPKEPGLYWFRAAKRVTMVLVRFEDRKSGYGPQMIVEWFGCYSLPLIPDDALWLGPIDPPEIPNR